VAQRRTRGKLTPYGRMLLVDRVVNQGWSPAVAAEAAGVSRATVYKWLPATAPRARPAWRTVRAVRSVARGCSTRSSRRGSSWPAGRRRWAERRAASRGLGQFAATWDGVSDALAVRQLAEPLLARHTLRAADAAHLASALLLSRELGQNLDFVCLDERLARRSRARGPPRPTCPAHRLSVFRTSAQPLDCSSSEEPSPRELRVAACLPPTR
jgi:predicted nucleic acid-binding protein